MPEDQILVAAAQVAGQMACVIADTTARQTLHVLVPQASSVQVPDEEQQRQIARSATKIQEALREAMVTEFTVLLPRIAAALRLAQAQS